MLLPLLLAFQASAAASPAPQAWHAPPPAVIEKIEAKLHAMGLPPGLEVPVDDPAVIHQATIAPLFHQPFACSEHPAGQLHGLGDALGTDCMMVGGIEGDAGFERMYKGDGARNEDWVGWRAEIHAPFDGVVKFIHINPVTNTPGTMGPPPASMMMFERADGLDVVYAHIMDPRVKVGDHVTAGQVVAMDGNNGPARNPHVHVGAFKGREPLQIHWNLKAMGAVPALAAN